MNPSTRPPSRLRIRSDHRARLSVVDAILDDAYGAPLHLLQNKRDPLDEAVYIILSLQTDIPRLKLIWGSLRAAFPSWKDAREAKTDALATALHAGGLHNQKARTIKKLLTFVSERFGDLSLDPLRDLPTEAAERELTRLPGLSWKAARCVLLYSLDREVFPVDTNTFRIMKRLGILSRHEAYRRKSVHDALQDAVPAHRRKTLHVNLVVHGRRICTPHRPRCSTCIAHKICPRAGVAPKKVRRGE